ncbi:hypothetical protein SNEBB_007436 [Seison nebaliae]|nr:hypothetical protein SNEBB_007436 [Seison nebaliae]
MENINGPRKNFQYVLSTPGILQIIVMVCCFCGIVSASIPEINNVNNAAGRRDFYLWVTISGLIITGIFFLVHMFSIPKWKSKWPWSLYEFIYHTLWALQLLIASSLLADISATRPDQFRGFSAAAFFGLLATVVYVVLAVFNGVHLLRWRKDRSKRHIIKHEAMRQYNRQSKPDHQNSYM